MESSVAPLPRRPSHRTYRSLLHHLCSSFDREPRISLATPALLQELVLRIEIALESPGETEKPPENLLRSDGGCGDSRAEKVEMISKELMLGDVFDGIDYHQITDGEEKRQKKKKRRRKKDKDLDEDDYLLLEDHNVKFQKRKFKRLKKDGGNGQGGSSDDELDGSGGARKVAEEMIKDYLFDDVDGGEEELAAEEDVVGSEDEMADFIVDEDGVGPSKRGSHSSAIREALEIFGCPKKFRKKSSVSSDWTELKRRLDPCEKYSDAICQLDIPERMQMFLKSTGSPPIGKISIEEESNWIYAQLIFKGQGFSVNKDDIANFLELHHVQKFEIPFIATYRKKQCRSLLGSADGDDVNLEKRPGTKWHKVFWMVQDLDREWLLLQKRKIALHGYYKERFEKDRRVYDETRPNLNQNLFESVIKSLKRAETEREVDDVHSMFKLHFPRADEGQNKEPKRKSKYSICSKAGLWQVANKFGYSAEQLGRALSLGKLVDELQDANETPEEMALNFECAMFQNPQAVLKGARYMAAVEISCEPAVKKYVRGYYMENAVVSTNPTPNGIAVIDCLHQFYGVKWLREKPLSKFEGAQWLLIQKAEEERLLQVTFKLPENFMNRLISDCNEHYLSIGVSKYAQLWNEQRKLILEDALCACLLPSMEKEARSLLTSRAKSRLLSEYGQALWKKVSSGPYLKKNMDISSDEEAAPRVMACYWGPGKPPNTFVMLDSLGEVVGSLILQSQNVNAQQHLLKFMKDHQPHVVALGAVNLSCRCLEDDIYDVIKVIFQMLEGKTRDVGHGMDDLSIVYVDESLPRLYESSRISGEQLPKMSGIEKRAVALGRYLQNPLAMVATLCGPDREILSWQFHPLENFLQPDEKYGMVEQVMVDITNQVGIDINLAASHEWFFSPLQFISGLGPMKAASLQRSLVRAGSIFDRNNLRKHGLGQKVFKNAAGFLRIRRSGLAASSSQLMSLLDDTRIHPESYGWIQENKKETYSNIMRGLSCRFQDWRVPFTDPSPDEEFYMISGETEETICEGKIVQTIVRGVHSGITADKFDYRFSGMLTKDVLARGWRRIVMLSEMLNEGDILTCKIKSSPKNFSQVFVIFKGSEMRNSLHQHKQDPYYVEDINSLQAEKEKARKQKGLVREHFESRKIVHHFFRNFSTDQAIEYLSDKEFGESIIHPSSKGFSYLTLTLKIYDGVYAHKDILEGGKGNEYMSQSIGKTLEIEKETFEELDEVMYRYVDPLVCHLKTMLNYQKFRKGTKSEVDELLRIEKGENPTRIVYCFGISHEHPGTFILSYIRSTNPQHEYVDLYHKGFKFKEWMFKDIDSLVSYVQEHIIDPFEKTVPSIRSPRPYGGGRDGRPPRPYGCGGRGRGQRYDMTSPSCLTTF